MLLTYEKYLLSFYVTQSKIRQGEVYDQAVNNPAISGPLLKAYRWIYENT